jgi:hypothetical protein
MHCLGVERSTGGRLENVRLLQDEYNVNKVSTNEERVQTRVSFGHVESVTGVEDGFCVRWFRGILVNRKLVD